MLRNRTRTVTSKQAQMADHQAHVASTSSVFARFTNSGFTKKALEIETMTPSPTSILDTKQFFPNNDHKSPPKTQRKGDWEDGNQERIGLALIDSLNEKDNEVSHSVTRKVLKIQIPQIEPNFGTKTRNSPFSKPQSPFRNSSFNSPKIFNISATDMERSEDYTRVVAHGPSPRTIHIYDDCVLECCNGVVGLSELKMELPLSPSVESNLAIESFLSFCCSCKKKLDHGKDIYMYRGEKGFCSLECRYKEMLSDREGN